MAFVPRIVYEFPHAARSCSHSAGRGQGSGPLAELELNGRGSVLVPSVFCRRITVYISLADPDGPAVMFYPALHDLTDAYRLWAGRHLGSTQKALAALLGDTRAAALDVISTGCTTTELADRLGLSPATASYHVAVLRDAGMINSHRRGSTVLRTITRLGTALLNGSAEPLADLLTDHRRARARGAYRRCVRRAAIPWCSGRAPTTNSWPARPAPTSAPWEGPACRRSQDGPHRHG